MGPMTGGELSRLAEELGLDAVGAAPVAAYDGTERHIRERRARGLFADMRFTMARPEVSCHPETLLPGARTVVSAALSYYAPAPEQPERPAGGLTFPDPDLIPDYWDFLYYSFVIGMCFQTSDVSVVRADIRRYTLLHSVFAYLYAVGLLSWLLSAMNSAF